MATPQKGRWLETWTNPETGGSVVAALSSGPEEVDVAEDSVMDMAQPMTAAYKAKATIMIFRPNMVGKRYRTDAAVANRLPIIRIRRQQ